MKKYVTPFLGVTLFKSCDILQISPVSIGFDLTKDNMTDDIWSKNEQF